MENLAQELQDHILDLFDLESDQDCASLSAMGRTCKQLAFPSQRRLFESVFFHPKGGNDYTSLRRLKELNALTSTNGGGSHLLAYIKKVRYTIAAPKSVSKEGLACMREERSAVEQLVPGLRAAHTLTILPNIPSDEPFPDMGAWGDNVVQDAHVAIMLALSSIPNLKAFHVRHIAIVPVPAIRWNSLTSLHLNAVGLDFEQISRPLFRVEESGTADRPEDLRPNLPVSTIEELKINFSILVDTTEFTDWILGVCQLKNLRYLGIQQDPELSAARLAITNRELDQSVRRLLEECKDTLEEVAIDMPSLDPCTHHDFVSPSNQASSAPTLQPLDLSSHVRLKTFKKGMICGFGGYNRLNETLLALGQTFSTIPRTEAVDQPPLQVHLHFVFHHFSGQTMSTRVFTDGLLTPGLNAIDRALAGKTREASAAGRPSDSYEPDAASLHISISVRPGSDLDDDYPTEDLISSFFPLLVTAKQLSIHINRGRGAPPDVVKCNEKGCGRWP